MAATQIVKQQAPIKKIKRQDLEEFLSKLHEVRQLERKARTLRDVLNVLTKQIIAFVDDQKSGKVRSIDKWGYRLTVDTAQANPAWKEEFVKALGEEAALQVSNEDRPKDKLVVQAISARAANATAA